MSSSYLEELKQETDRAIEQFNTLYQSDPDKAIALAREIMKNNYSDANSTLTDVLNNSTGDFKKNLEENKERKEIQRINEYLNRSESDTETDND